MGKASRRLQKKTVHLFLPIFGVSPHVAERAAEIVAHANSRVNVRIDASEQRTYQASVPAVA